MSRTIRRLPIVGGGIKWHAIVKHIEYSDRRIRNYKVGVNYSKKHNWPTYPEDMDKWGPGYHYTNLSPIRPFFYIDTEADIDKQRREQYLMWCKKNGTCKRQRQNAVRKCKRIASGKARAQGARELLQALYQYETQD